MPIVDIRPQDLGVKVIHAPTDVDEVEVDIVAVHGIGAHPQNTWTHSKTGTNWLSDLSMLPSALPTSRILSFGYDSVWFGQKAVKQSLSGVARKLLRGLREERANCSHRPIIFIGHCFGGLVLQKAFMMALTHETDYPNILHSTRGMVFMGTPFRGVPENSDLKTPGAIYDAIVAQGVDYQDSVLLTIAQDNELLTATVAEFTRIVGTSPKPPMLFCFYEQRATNIGAIVGIETRKAFVATEVSATLDGHSKDGLPLDHFQMNKFENSQDGNYKSVKTEIEDMVKKAKDDVDEVASMPQPHPSDRRVNVPFAPDLARKRSYFAERGGILKSIEERFSKRTRVALFGDEGTGKTHIAVEYARKYLTDSPSARVFWVNAGSPAELMLSFKRIAAELSLPKDDEISGRIVVSVRDHLARDFHVQWLLVLDGLDDLDVLQSLNPDVNRNDLSFLFPDGDDSEDGRVLVTTRGEDLAFDLVKMKKKYALSVGTLKKEDISQIVYGRITKETLKQKWAEDVAVLLKGSAGALDLVRMHFKFHKEAKKGEYFDFLRSAIGTGLDPVDAVWARLFELVCHEHEEAKLWLTFGVLNVQTIPRAFFSKHEKSAVLPVLVNIGVVEQLPDRSSYRVPDFSRACAQRWLERQPVKRSSTESMVLQQVLAAWKSDKLDPMLPLAWAVSNFHPTSTKGRQALEAIWERLSRKGRADEKVTAPRSFVAGNAPKDKLPATQSRTTPLPKELASGQEHERGHPIRQKQIEDVKQRLLLDSPKVPSSSTSKARESSIRTVKQQSRRLEKLQIQDPAWNEPQTWRAAHDLASMRLEQNQHKPETSTEIVSLCEEILRKKTDKAATPSQLVRSQYNLALAHESGGNLVEAIRMGCIALDGASLGQSPSERELFLRIKMSLAAWYAASSRGDEALRVFEELLPAMENELPPDDPLSLEARRNYGMFLTELGKLETAEAVLVEVFQAQELVRGLYDRDCLRTSCQIASVWARQGHKAEAEERFRSVLEKQEETLGAGHVDVLMTRRLLEELS